MSKLYTTRSGTRYEVDEAASRMRRLGGSDRVPLHHGPDGEWSTYEQFAANKDGLVFFWPRSACRCETPCGMPATFTSPVKSVQEVQ